MELAGYLKRGKIILNLRGGTHDEVIHELVDVICPDSGNGRRKILESIYTVEDIRNTAVGRGVAIPHGRTDSVSRMMISLGKCEKGIEWGAPDGKPVRLVWVIVNPPDEIETYLSVLAQIMKVCVRKGAREAILNARNPEEIIRIIEESGCREKKRL